MGLSLYAPASSRIVHYAYVDFVSRQIGRPVHIVQYDDSMPILAVRLFRDGKSFAVSESADVNIRMNKPDGKFVYNPALGSNASRETIYFEITPQMASYAGEANPVVEVDLSGSIASSSPIDIIIDRNPVQIGQIESSNEGKSLLGYVAESKEAAESALKSKNAAKTSETNAKASETNAKLSENNAKDSEVKSGSNAVSAKECLAKVQQSENNASRFANNASDSARSAESRMLEAAEYAKTSKSYADGTSGSRPGEETDNAKFYYENARSDADTVKEYLTKVEKAGTDAVDAIRSAFPMDAPNFLMDLSTGHLTYSGDRFVFEVNSAGHLMWGMAV